jgi:UDP-N-acetylglucosamine transferase subunit ALG13
MGEADTVIAHAGAGTILVARNMGHVPVVMPRLKRFGETVDDHQVELAIALEQAGQVTAVWDAASLPACVAQSPKRRTPTEAGGRTLQDAVRSALQGTQS